jgi:PAS domain S-box-containing protein
MIPVNKINILLVDDQPSKLLTYEVILRELGENLIKASSGKEALEQLLRNEIAVVLMDVSMPELDGFQLASMIREHPRFQKIAMIFVSAIHLAEIDHLRGYEMGAVDYVPVPVVPEVLRAKVRVFADLYRKNRQLERLNAELEERVNARTAELQASTQRLMQSEQRRSLALAAGNMGSWDWDLPTNKIVWDEGQHAIYGVTPAEFVVTPANFKVLILPEDWERLQVGMDALLRDGAPHQAEYRIRRPNGEIRWCASIAAASQDESGKVVRISGVTMDITERKEAEERQALLAREVDHRAKNAMAIVQSIVRLTKADSISEYAGVIEGRIKALSRAHALLSDARWQGAEMAKLVEEELAPYRSGHADRIRIAGPRVVLEPTTAQTLALALHELSTNAVKYGSLSQASGRLELNWDVLPDEIVVTWRESGGPAVQRPSQTGFGAKIITSSIQRQLEGKVSFDWRPEGLFCELRAPRRYSNDSTSDTVVSLPAGHSSKKLPSERILIVEDEALVAMILEDQLADLGISVAATCASVPDAMRAIENSAPQAAILDVNLRGQLVYPVADCLMDRGIPFVFVTGYGRESIDRRYSFVKVLEKPVERQALEGLFASAPELSSVAPVAQA